MTATMVTETQRAHLALQHVGRQNGGRDDVIPGSIVWRALFNKQAHANTHTHTRRDTHSHSHTEEQFDPVEIRARPLSARRPR